MITALFCDLVGFTATSEGADPEDVDRMLTAYFQAARSQIELHGGVVEKFIGDAVVGVFGVPLAHGDDPERAVRAALRIADDATRLQALNGAPLRLRIGINTGEALVRLDLDPGSGERFMAGDSVNTASRIQSVAPEMGVAVGEDTWRATSQRFDYSELPPAVLKGKAEPVRVFHAIAPRSSLGVDVARVQHGPFVGRAAELGAIVACLDRVVAGSRREVATIIGEPGIGKSRLVSELLAHVDTHPALVTWRQGRCLPYGSGIAFWALGEIVRGQAGILESDPTAVAIAKLDDVLPEGDERAWFRERLLPLLGIESGSSASREEQFTAWRRFLELLAAERPTVLVFEDLHWADEAMLTFLEDLAASPSGVPLLIVGTARPELLERRPGFPGTAEGAVRIDLQPLPPDVATTLLRDLVDGTAIAPRLLEPILERAAGNPLFVEEFIRLLRDQDLLRVVDGVTDVRDVAAIPVPDTIQALLAARIDALPAPTKAVLSDAAVVGKVFWGGAIAAMGGLTPADVRAALEVLTQRELIRPEPRSSMAGEEEYAFWHVLARDVAYAAMPRARRASRHVAVARWTEAMAGDRVEVVAQIVAHHYSTALELALAVGDDVLAAELRPLALGFLLMAGRSALSLDVPAALGLLERALVLAPAGHPDRAAVLDPYGQGLNHAGRYAEAVAAWEEAAELYRSGGSPALAGDVMGRMAAAFDYMGNPRSRSLLDEAVALLEPLGPTPQLATALRRLATRDVTESRFDEALIGLERAAAVGRACVFADERHATIFDATLRGWRGLVRVAQGDPAGSGDVEQSVERLTAAGDGRVALDFRINLASAESLFALPGEVLLRLEEALAFGRARGLRASLAWLETSINLARYDLGQLDAMLADESRIDAELAGQGATAVQLDLRAASLRARLLRGQDPGVERLAWMERTAREIDAPESWSAGLGTVAAVRLMLGEADEARRLLRELADRADVGTIWWFQLLPTLVRTAIDVGDLDLAQAILGHSEPQPLPSHECWVVAARAALHRARGELADAEAAYADAISRCEALEMLPDLAAVLLGHGQTLLDLGRPVEAREPLERAREIYRDLDAAPGLRDVDVAIQALETRSAGVGRGGAT